MIGEDISCQSLTHTQIKWLGVGGTLALMRQSQVKQAGSPSALGSSLEIGL